MTVEERVTKRAKELVESCPALREPSIEFKRDWAFGNAGLEDERITREQVRDTIKD